MAGLPVGIRIFSPFYSKLSSTAKTFAFKAYIIVFTFLIYTSYHLSRKPISVVKNVLHRNCSFDNGSYYSTNCSWAPFDQDNSAELLGSLDYAFLFAYALGMFVSGHVAERMNLRYFLFIGMTMSGIFTALFGMARYWGIHMLWYFIVVQVIAGFFQSTGWPSVVACMANWYGKGNRGLIMGIWNAHTSVGNILGSIIPGVFVSYNWGLSFIVPGAIIFGMGVLVLLFLVPHPNDVGLPDANAPKSGIINGGDDIDEEEEETLLPPSEQDQVQVESPHKAISIFAALQIPGVVEFALCLFFAKLVSYTFLFWLPSYIKYTTSYGPEKAADLSTAFDFGGIIGAMAAGFISDRTGKSATTCLVMFILAAPALFIYNAFGNASMASCVILLLIAGALVNGPYGLITTAVSADLGTHSSLRGNSKALSTVTAIIDGTGSMGAALGPLLTGLIAPSGWQNVFYMLITADVLALLVSVLIIVRQAGGCHQCCFNTLTFPRIMSLLFLSLTLFLVVLFLLEKVLVYEI